jgi:hypothetical protein
VWERKWASARHVEALRLVAEAQVELIVGMAASSDAETDA